MDQKINMIHLVQKKHQHIKSRKYKAMHIHNHRNCCLKQTEMDDKLKRFITLLVNHPCHILNLKIQCVKSLKLNKLQLKGEF